MKRVYSSDCSLTRPDFMPTRESETDYLIQIVGPHKLVNELMAGFLEKETGIKCRGGPERGRGSGRTGDRRRKPNLVMVDCQGADEKNIWVRLEALSNPDQADSIIAIFNVSRGLGIEKKAIERGIRGVFLEKDAKDLFPKAIRAILSGELWCSRETLTKCVMEARDAPKSDQTPLPQLTPREKEILVSLAAGAGNEDIAEKLGISPHTVKTHVYNLYQKIDVSNRLQAALWAAKTNHAGFMGVRLSIRSAEH